MVRWVKELYKYHDWLDYDGGWEELIPCLEYDDGDVFYSGPDDQWYNLQKWILDGCPEYSTLALFEGD